MNILKRLVLLVCVSSIIVHSSAAQKSKARSTHHKIRTQVKPKWKVRSIFYTQSFQQRHCIWSYTFATRASKMMFCDMDTKYLILDQSPSSDYLLIQKITATHTQIDLYDVKKQKLISNLVPLHSAVIARFLDDETIVVVEQINTAKSEIDTRTKIWKYDWKTQTQDLVYHSSKSFKKTIPLTLSPDKSWISFVDHHARHSFTLLDWKYSKTHVLTKGYTSLAWSNTRHEWNAFHYPTKKLKYDRRQISPKRLSKITKNIHHVISLLELPSELTLRIEYVQSSNFQLDILYDKKITKNKPISTQAQFNFKLPFTQQVAYDRSNHRLFWIERDQKGVYLRSRMIRSEGSLITLTDDQYILFPTTEKILNFFLSAH